ncbi:cell division protein FtsL [Denitrobaculum tricleocarpae]|uniref:Cell division protein FtsL n=1 Tax=Denitrobaculum tricleocarpae TaxID=2591009 RepID=A0A545T0T6_9PROT|nr:hypothetical protein [Denitrobaculum tricleocarpae]TQV70838.1 hypothetical protein FKG95_27345 [Denitrobaculum tricleocarpae]
MNKLALCAWLAACALSIWFAFHIKYKVQELETELGIARAEMQQDSEAIRVLEAEWSFLNQPSHLADLSERHLDFAPLLAEQVVHLDDLPVRESQVSDSQDSEGLEDIIEEILRNAPEPPKKAGNSDSNGNGKRTVPLMRTGASQ